MTPAKHSHQTAKRCDEFRRIRFMLHLVTFHVDLSSLCFFSEHGESLLGRIIFAAHLSRFRAHKMLVSHELLIITYFLNIFVLPYFNTDIVLQAHYWE